MAAASYQSTAIPFDGSPSGGAADSSRTVAGSARVASTAGCAASFGLVTSVIDSVVSVIASVVSADAVAAPGSATNDHLLQSAASAVPGSVVALEDVSSGDVIPSA